MAGIITLKKKLNVRGIPGCTWGAKSVAGNLGHSKKLVDWLVAGNRPPDREAGEGASSSTYIGV